jgi:hypothetical protein
LKTLAASLIMTRDSQNLHLNPSRSMISIDADQFGMRGRLSFGTGVNLGALNWR